MQYKIFEGNMERLEKKLQRISNKCKKYGNFSPILVIFFFKTNSENTSPLVLITDKHLWSGVGEH